MTETGHEYPLVNYEHERAVNRQRVQEWHEGERGRGFTTRAQVRLIQGCLKEVRVGGFRFLSDERPPRGLGAAPLPLQFLVASVGL